MQRITVLGLFMVLMAGCSGPVIEDYVSHPKALSVEAFFNGQLSAHGIVKDRSGLVIRTFNAELEGQWRDAEGLLKERFVFDDGELQYRNWQLSPQNNRPDSYIGQAEDVVGNADIQVRGNAMFIDYTLRIPYGDSHLDIAVDDRMYLVSDRVLINETRLTKWGIHVGDVILTIIKR